MRISLKQYLNHALNLLNGEARTEDKRRKASRMEEEIRNWHLQTENYRGTDKFFYRMNHLNRLQNQYRDLTGKFYPIAGYEEMDLQRGKT